MKGKGSLFKKLLGFMVLACILTSLLSVLLICLTSAGAFAKRIADEIVPRAHAISRLASRYQTGQISYDSFLDIALREQQGAEIYIIDESGMLIISSSQTSNSTEQPAVDDMLAQYAGEILRTGETRIWINWKRTNGIVVGTAIRDNLERSNGVVLMTKRTSDVFASMAGLFLIIVGNCLVASVLMIIPAYFCSKRIAKPINQMTEVSSKMASGDFSARADEGGNDEIGQLGAALNHLSTRLCININDLLLTQNRLHLILNGIHEGVLAFDADARLTYCNRAALLLYGVDSMDALAKCLPDVSRGCAEAVRTGEPHAFMTERGEKKLLFVVSCSQENSGAIRPGTVAVVQDVTASERLEQTRRDYVANVSHELRTPIASIRSLAETLNDGLVKSEDDRNRYYGYILRESMRLSRLINDLLELSRLQSGGVALEKRGFDLAEALSDVADRMRITAGYSGISVLLDVASGEKLPAFSNSDRIEQVLIALMDNAIKFAADDGVIRLEVTEEAECYWVLVKNTGHIAETDLPHLFDRFYKADASHSDAGTGLGLAIVREVLTLLGEEILAENQEGFVVFRFTVAKESIGL